MIQPSLRVGIEGRTGLDSCLPVSLGPHLGRKGVTTEKDRGGRNSATHAVPSASFCAKMWP